MHVCQVNRKSYYTSLDPNNPWKNEGFRPPKICVGTPKNEALCDFLQGIIRIPPNHPIPRGVKDTSCVSLEHGLLKVRCKFKVVGIVAMKCY